MCISKILYMYRMRTYKLEGFFGSKYSWNMVSLINNNGVDEGVLFLFNGNKNATRGELLDFFSSTRPVDLGLQDLNNTHATSGCVQQTGTKHHD